MFGNIFSPIIIIKQILLDLQHNIGILLFQFGTIPFESRNVTTQPSGLSDNLEIVFFHIF